MKAVTQSACKLSVAPMIDVTDKHRRFFHRLLVRQARVYTEMISTAAIEHGDRARLLGFNPQEHPVALQLGCSEPQRLAAAARIGEQWGYDEINLNCGCPSARGLEGSEERWVGKEWWARWARGEVGASA